MDTGFLTTLITTTGDSLSSLWAQVLGFLPALIGAIVIFIIGLIVASRISVAKLYGSTTEVAPGQMSNELLSLH